MSDYKFSLQNVLDWRADKEDEMKLKFVEVKQAQAIEERQLQQLINENIRLKEKSSSPRKIDAMRQDDLYKEVLDEKIIQQRLVVDKARQTTKEVEADLLKAYQDKKVMEKLKEKEREEYIEEMNKQEQKKLDAFATMTFGRESF